MIGKEDGGGEGDEREKERRAGTGSADVMGVLDVPDLEDRLRAEASAIGLLGDDESEPIIPADDEIASTLRRLQRVLRAQSALNLARKQILQDRAHDALAYAEYRSTLRTTLDRPIVTSYTKILRSAAAKPGKKGKNKVIASNLAANEEKISAGGVPLELPPELVERLRLRKRFVDSVGAMLRDDGDDEDKLRGRVAMVLFPTPTLLPRRSIYEGVEEQVEKELGWPFQSVVAGVIEAGPGASGANGAS